MNIRKQHELNDLLKHYHTKLDEHILAKHGFYNKDLEEALNILSQIKQPRKDYMRLIKEKKYYYENKQEQNTVFDKELINQISNYHNPKLSRKSKANNTTMISIPKKKTSGQTSKVAKDIEVGIIEINKFFREYYKNTKMTKIQFEKFEDFRRFLNIDKFERKGISSLYYKK